MNNLMARVKHWRPSYLCNRLRSACYDWFNPGQPWLTKYANQILSSILKNTDKGLEFGSGRSTVWFAKRSAALVSIEHNPEWFASVKNDLVNQRISNVTQYLFNEDENIIPSGSSRYVHILDGFEPATFDFVLVDGIFRSSCAISSIRVLRPGGLLILDNCNWYLPSDSCSPNSRAMADGPVSEEWSRFLALTNDWRRIWTSDGVTDTVIFMKK